MDAFVKEWVDRAIAEFDHNPLYAQLLTRLAHEEGESFSDAAMRHLSAATGDAKALRFLSGLFVRQKFVYERLSDPAAATRERSISVFRRLIAVDPSFDVKLAKMLPDRTGANHEWALAGARGVRAIDILDEGSRGTRLVPIIAHLTEWQDAELSAKATLFIGRRIRNAAWAEKQLEQKDPRVRANAIESLWGVDTAAARAVLRRSVNDASNRVAGNALVGLHLLGDTGIIEEVARLAEEENPKFRATAAWSMGKIADVSFVPRLTALVKDEHEMVRSAALQGLIGLRREEARAATISAAAIVAATAAVAAPVEAVEIAVEEAAPQEAPVFNLRLDGSSYIASRG